jgi:hypothetical protein
LEDIFKHVDEEDRPIYLNQKSMMGNPELFYRVIFREQINTCFS